MLTKYDIELIQIGDDVPKGTSNNNEQKQEERTSDTTSLEALFK